MRGMVSRAEIFRAKAQECERRAQIEGIGPLRETLLEIAAKWRLMADNAERRLIELGATPLDL